MPDVVLPVLDEAEALPWVLGRMPDGYRAIVVDNGSTDGSGDIAAELAATVVFEPQRGFGAACWAGLVAADADGTWPLHARAANRFLAWELGRRTGVRLSDIGPMRAAHRTALLELGITDRRFGWPLEMVLRAAAAGWRIDEVSVPYRERSGRSKVTGTVKGTARAVRDMSGVLRTV